MVVLSWSTNFSILLALSVVRAGSHFRSAAAAAARFSSADERRLARRRSGRGRGGRGCEGRGDEVVDGEVADEGVAVVQLHDKGRGYGGRGGDPAITALGASIILGALASYQTKEFMNRLLRLIES